jgi:hypothetical protein
MEQNKEATAKIGIPGPLDKPIKIAKKKALDVKEKPKVLGEKKPQDFMTYYQKGNF